MQAPIHIINHRREVCERCQVPCEHRLVPAYLSEGDNACPRNKWMAFKTFARNKMRGAGDVVAAVAQPIAGAIDAVFKTKVKSCSACAKRREMLNEYIPFPPFNQKY